MEVTAPELIYLLLFWHKSNGWQSRHDFFFVIMQVESCQEDDCNKAKKK
jgi:hypothetical protein